MNVLLISPGYPSEMPLFTRGLARVGARVVGLGDQPKEALPTLAREHLTAYVRVPNLWNEALVVNEIRNEARRTGIGFDRIECLWEPGMILAARLREAFGAPGLTVEQTVPFRDKEQMKQVLDKAGIRTPRHFRAATIGACREAAEQIGYPVIVKPIAGAGSADTYRIDAPADMNKVLDLVRHVPEVSVEEFIDGDEFTFDTVCADGRVLYYNICMYRPRPLISRTVEWVSPQTIALRDPDAEDLRGGRDMGYAVLKALGFKTGFTHMEWYRKADGEVVFGEIGARPPGARTVDSMNFACDIDLFTGWAEAVCHGRISQPIERRYNAAQICKRAKGAGTVQRIEGLGHLLAEFGPAVVHVDLVTPGQPRRNWLQSLLSDGYLVVRHPDLATTLRMADRIGTDLQLFAE